MTNDDYVTRDDAFNNGVKTVIDFTIEEIEKAHSAAGKRTPGLIGMTMLVGDMLSRVLVEQTFSELGKRGYQ